MTDFVHLHLHTEYSLLDGAVKCGELMDHCVKNGIKAVAITDHGNMYATLKFAEEAKKKGIKYIIGCEFYCCNDIYGKKADNNEFEHLILLAKNKKGYKNLVRLDSIAFTDGFYYKPRIDYKILKEHSEGLICLSACLAGRLPRLILKGNLDGAKKFASEMKALFGEDFYIEIQDHGIPEQKMSNPYLVQIAEELGIEIVATNDVHYLRQEDAEMQDVLLCIQTKKTLDDPKRMKFSTQEFYLKTGDQMAALFPQWPKAISNTVAIADKVTEEVFPLDKNGYPVRNMALIPMYTTYDPDNPETPESVAAKRKDLTPLKKFLNEASAKGLSIREYFRILEDMTTYLGVDDTKNSKFYVKMLRHMGDYFCIPCEKGASFSEIAAALRANFAAVEEDFRGDTSEETTFYLSRLRELPARFEEGLASDANYLIDRFREFHVYLSKCVALAELFGIEQTDPSVFDSKNYLRKLSCKGLLRRYKEITEVIKKRAKYELGIICGMGYADYYLIVWDYINWSKDHGIPIGPGRGSGVSSIVAYAIGITDVEPLQYNLLFERFLNPDRVSMPDFDVDFCTDRRQESIEYVRRKYGSPRVAQIVTFGTMASRQAIKDTGRVMRVPYSETDKVAKLMDGKTTIRDLLGLNIPGLEKKIESAEDEEKRAELQKNLEELKGKVNPEFIEQYQGDQTLHDVIDMAMRIEGMPRNTSMHAAGVVICQQVISDNVPLSRNGEDEVTGEPIVTTQFNMKEIEALGMLKMDFLALTTLTDIKKTCDYILEDYGVLIDFDQIGYEDAGTYELISNGETDGVFQLEQGGMKKFMRDLKPDRLEDLIAGISLYRPGPMKDIPRYCENKNHPEKITYDTPLLEHILNVTYGVPIYQEQVMNIFQDLAGFSLGQADLVRRAMGKKDKKTLMAQKDKFIHGDVSSGGNIKGCVANGVPEEVAAKIFENMESFASYAFNKSHAAAYAVVSYQTAYLKKYYIKEFLAGLLNNRITKSDEITKYTVFMKEQNIPVFPPDINLSKAEFSVQGDGVRFGLCALKGVGRAAIDAVVENRTQKGKFTSFADFLMRCTRYVNKRIVEGLIYGGAFDAFGKTRSQLFAVYDDAMNRIAAINKQQDSAQMSFFGDIIEEKEIELVYPDIPEFELNEKLAKEKLVLGVYVSGHPFEKYKDAFADMNFNCSYLQDYQEEVTEDGEEIKIYENVQDGQVITMGGMISAYRKLVTKSGTYMAFVTVEDMYGSVECVAFPKVYEKIKHFLASDVVVTLKGKIDLAQGKAPSVILDSMTEYKKQEEEKRTSNEETEVKHPVLWLNASGFDEEDLEDLIATVKDYPDGDTIVKIVVDKKVCFKSFVNLDKKFKAILLPYFDDEKRIVLKT